MVSIKRLMVIALCIASCLATRAQGVGTAGIFGEPKGYELERNFPLFMDSVKAHLSYPMAWGNAPHKDFDEWRTVARAKVKECMLMAPPKPAEWQMEVVDSEQRNGYKALKIRFNISAWSRINAYLLVPDGSSPHPGVIVYHDHGGHYSIGKEKVVRPFGVSDEVMDDALTWAKNGYDSQFLGDWLASNGYLVLAYDALFWSERGRKEGISGDDHMLVAGHFMMLGCSWSGWTTHEDILAAEFLASLPNVASERIACTGWSIGGYRAWMTAAMTDRIKCAVPVCWMTTTDVQMSWEYGNEYGGFANQLPGLRLYMDYPHIASMACPKAMYFINGMDDALFKPVGVNAAFKTMRAAWDSQGVGDRLKTELLPMSHHCGKMVQERIVEFLKAHL